VTKLNNGAGRIRFGQFEADFSQEKLLKRGVVVRLENRPFQVLAALLESPGILVTREELQARLWPAGTYVDFDEGLNTAVRKLRAALGDLPDSPVFVETVPRRGYVFVAPVEYAPTAPVLASPVKPESTNSNGTPAVHASVESHSTPASPKMHPRLFALIAAVCIFAIAAIGVWWQTGYRTSTRGEPEFTRMSFGRGLIMSARFAPDGQSVVYGAAWDGKPFRLFLARSGNADALALNADGEVLSISRSGEMAVLLHRHFGFGESSRGTLGLMSMTGDSPREILEDVGEADWSPDGSKLAVIHWTKGKCRLEYPVGNVIYEPANGTWMSHLRVSPAGDRIGFLEHPLDGDDSGHVANLTLSGRREVLSKDFSAIVGLVWAPAGDRLVFGAREAGIGGGRALFTVGLDGKPALLRRETGNLTVQDITKDGQLLLTRDVKGDEVFGRLGADEKDRSLGWRSVCLPTSLSDDGKYLLLSVQGEMTGRGYQIFLSSTALDGPPVLLGEGMPAALSPNLKSAMVLYPWGMQPSAISQLRLIPIGPGIPQEITRDSLTHVKASWFPDGKKLVFIGAEPGHANRSWRQDLDGGKPVPITPEGVTGTRVSPDGRTLAAVDATRHIWLYPVDAGPPRHLAMLDAVEEIDRWSNDGHNLFLTKYGVPAEVYRLDTRTGERKFLYKVSPADPAGVSNSGPVLVTSDGKSYVYGYTRVLSTLYVVRGL
jgi:DNA-binding winged helix-turn-helix (wHTH) protein/Tol biopolymer transport system component